MQDTYAAGDDSAADGHDGSPGRWRPGVRLNTALVTARDTVVAMLITVPIVLPLRWIVRALGAPEPSADLNRFAQLLESDAAWVVPIALAASSFGFLAVGIWFRRQRDDSRWEWRRRRKVPSWPRLLALGVGLGWAIVIVGGIIGASWARVLGLDYAESPEVLALGGAHGTVLLFIFVEATLFGPISEELFFRGHLFRRAESRCGLLYAQVLTAVIFALIHLNLAGVPSYIVASLIMCWGYERWRTLAVPVIAHITMNTIGFTVIILGHRAGAIS